MSRFKANQMRVYLHSCEYHGFWCLGFLMRTLFVRFLTVFMLF